MKKLLSNRGFLGALIVIALVGGIAIGGAFFARTISDDDTGEAQPPESTATTSTTAGSGAGDAGSDAGADGGSGGGEEYDGGAGADGGSGGGDVTDPRGIEVVQASNGRPYTYRDEDRSPTELPQELPVEVRMSSTQDLTAGQGVDITVVPTEGSEMFGFQVRMCKPEAALANLYDFLFPTLNGDCVSAPLSPGSDSFLEVKADPPYQTGSGTFRVGTGTDNFTLDDGQTRASVTCDRTNPCQLAVLVHVPYGFGILRYDLSFA
jgi:hypothetical protein